MLIWLLSATGDRLSRCHRLDGVLWPRESTGCNETGRQELPVVLLEVQTHRFLQQVAWSNLEALSRRSQLDPLLTEAEIMVIAGIPREEIRHTRAVQD